MDAQDDVVRRQINGHTLELDGCMWRCLQCGHWFDGAGEARDFWCGDPCVHPFATAPSTPAPRDAPRPGGR